MTVLEECGFAEELILLVDIDYHLVAVVFQHRDFHSAIEDEVKTSAVLVLIVDELTLLVLDDCGARQISQRILKRLLRF
jgi:ribosomal protein L25 (general stress protein Ctc)